MLTAHYFQQTPAVYAFAIIRESRLTFIGQFDYAIILGVLDNFTSTCLCNDGVPTVSYLFPYSCHVGEMFSFKVALFIWKD